MLNNLSDRITDFLIGTDRLKEEKGVAFSTQLYGIMLSGLLLMLSVLIGFLSGSIVHSLIITVVFLGLRTLTGGYHFEHIVFEIIIYSALIFVSTFLSVHLSLHPILIIITALCGILLNFMIPIEDPERNFSAEKAEKYRYAAIFLLMLCDAVACYLVFIGQYPYVSCIIYGILMDVLLVIPALVLNLIRYDRPQSWKYRE